MSSGGQVIRAAQQFTKQGRSKQVNFVQELVIGVSLGLVAGGVWKVYHWNEIRKIEQYYYDLAKMKKLEQQQQEG